MDKSTYVKINGKKVAGITALSSAFDREWEVADGKLVINTTRMIITLKRVATGATDGINLRALSDFTLIIATPSGVSTFTGCRWVGFYETVTDRIVEEMKIAALSYSLSA